MNKVVKVISGFITRRGTKYDFLKKTFFLFITNGLGRGATLLANILMARLLGMDIYGRYIYMFSIVLMLSLVPRFGFDQSLVRFIPMNLVNNNKRLNREIGTFAIASSIFISLIVIISLYFSRDLTMGVILGSSNRNYFQYYTTYLPMISLLALVFVVPSLFLARKKVVEYSIIMNGGKSFMFMVLIFVLYRVGVDSNIIPKLSMYISLLITIVVAFYSVIRRGYISKLNMRNSDVYKTFLGASAPLFLVSSLGLIMERINIYMIGYYVDSGEVAIYNSASQIAIITSFMLMAVNQVFSPTISELYTKGEIKRLNIIYSKIIVGLFLISSIILCVIILFRYQIMGIFGEGYIEKGVIILIIISIGQLINAVSGPNGYILVMTGNQNYNLLASVLTLSAVIFLNFILIPKFGVLGAAVSGMSALIINNILKLLFMKMRTGIIPFRFN